MTKVKRKRLLVDLPVQGALIRRLLVYWVACMLFITLPLAFVGMFAQAGKPLFDHYLDSLLQHWPILTALAVMVPFFLYDAIRFSHRFVGPISRLRRELVNFAAGKSAFPIEFRRGDFWRDLTDHINLLAERLEAAEKRADAAEAQLSSSCDPATDAYGDEAQLTGCS